MKREFCWRETGNDHESISTSILYFDQDFYNYDQIRFIQIEMILFSGKQQKRLITFLDNTIIQFKKFYYITDKDEFFVFSLFRL